MSRAPRATVRQVVSAVAAIGALDALMAARRWPVPVVAALDWPAHGTTAALLLGAAPRGPVGQLAGWALTGSIAIDVDHLPLYLGLERVAAGPDGRPVTHSLTTPAVLLVASGFAKGTMRTALAGLSVGVLLHFVRDIGTGPGLPLLWPLSRRNFRIPYAAYLAPVAAAALGRALADLRADRPGSVHPVA